jgi:RNA polymerase sigma-70 factor (ECF subfamily)
MTGGQVARRLAMEPPERRTGERPGDAIAGWLASARAGCGEALGRALEAQRNYLRQIARQEIDVVLAPKGDPSDLIQETFLEAQRDFDRFQGTSAEELRAWLRQLLHNVANFVRRFRGTDKRQVGREVALDPSSWSGTPWGNLPAETPSPSSHVRAEEQEGLLASALERLPEEYRQVLRGRYQEGLSFAEIAQALGRSPNAVRKLWARAVARLREEMGDSPGGAS